MQKTEHQEITGMNINVSAISTAVNMPVSTTIENIQAVTPEDAQLQRLRSYIMQGWLHKKMNWNTTSNATW